MQAEYVTKYTIKLCVYDINHINHVYALRIKNTSVSDRRSYEVTKAVAKKAKKNSKDGTSQFFLVFLCNCFSCS